MDLVELIEQRKNKYQQLTAVISSGKTEERKLNEAEEQQVNTLTSEIDAIDVKIEEINNRNNNTINTKNNMENFKDLIVRNADGTIQNMYIESRAIGLSSSVDNVVVAGDISSVGYKPFWQQMGVNYMPNLTSSIKLPYTGNVMGAKKTEGQAHTNDKALATVTLQPARYTITETVGKEIMAVGNEQALQGFIQELVKGCDKAITADIYTVAASGAQAITGMTGYTTTNIDTLVAGVDGEVTVLMPRAEFYKAKGVKADSGSGKFIAEKTSSFTANLWDGTPVFYSNLFDGDVNVAVDLQHVTVATFLNEGQEIEVSFLPIPSKGQVEITVCKLANVVLRNASAAAKAVIA